MPSLGLGGGGTDWCLVREYDRVRQKGAYAPGYATHDATIRLVPLPVPRGDSPDGGGAMKAEADASGHSPRHDVRYPHTESRVQILQNTEPGRTFEQLVNGVNH